MDILRGGWKDDLDSEDITPVWEQEDASSPSRDADLHEALYWLF